MFGRTVFILIAGGLLLALTAQAVNADQNIVINKDYQMAGKNVIVHFIEINITSYPMGNVFPSDETKASDWVHIVYQFQNIGDSNQKGFVQPTMISTDDKRFIYRDYTGEDVLPHTTTDPAFVEIPVPAGTKIKQIVFTEGFTEHVFEIPDVPAPTPTPVASASARPSATPAPNGNVAGCLPFVPFAMAGGIAAAGMVINRCGIRRK